MRKSRFIIREVTKVFTQTIKCLFVGILLVILVAGSEVSVKFNVAKIKEKKDMMGNIMKGVSFVKKAASVF